MTAPPTALAAESPVGPRASRGPGWLVGLLAVVGAVVCGLVWTVSSPVQGSPDEDYHLTSIWCAAGTTSTCRPAPSLHTVWLTDVSTFGAGQPQVRVPGLVGAPPPCFAFQPQVTPQCQDGYPAWFDTTRVNNGAVPPGFYRVMHVFVGPSVVTSVLLMRAFNLLLAVALLGLLYLAAATDTRRLMVYAVTLAGVPLGWYLVASVNPSGWAVTGVSACAFAMHSFLGEPGPRPLLRRGVNVAVAAIGAAMAVGSRGDAAVYVVVCAVALSVLHSQVLLRDKRLLALPAAVSLVGTFVLFRSAQVTAVAGASVVLANPRSPASEMLVLFSDLPGLVSGLFGYPLGLGWLDVPMPPITTLTVLGVVAYALGVASPRGDRSKRVAVGLVVFAMLAPPLFSLYRQRINIANVQPRYLYPLLPVLMLIAMTAVAGRGGVRLSRVQAWTIYVLLVVAHAAALTINTQRYVSGLNGLQSALQHWWWPDLPNPYLVSALGALGFAVFALLMVRVSVVAPSRTEPRPTRSVTGIWMADHAPSERPSGAPPRRETASAPRARPPFRPGR